jgi:hypothetical protein
MSCIYKLAQDADATGLPYIVSVRTIDGHISSGLLGYVDDNVMVLHPPETAEPPVESDLVAVTYFNMCNIISAWTHV